MEQKKSGVFLLRFPSRLTFPGQQRSLCSLGKKVGKSEGAQDISVLR